MPKKSAKKKMMYYTVINNDEEFMMVPVPVKAIGGQYSLAYDTYTIGSDCGTGLYGDGSDGHCPKCFLGTKEEVEGFIAGFNYCASLTKNMVDSLFVLSGGKESA